LLCELYALREEEISVEEERDSGYKSRI